MSSSLPFFVLLTAFFSGITDVKSSFSLNLGDSNDATRGGVVVDHAFGISEKLQQLACGDDPLRGYRNVEVENGCFVRHDFGIERVSIGPSVFILRKFCTIEECERIQHYAQTLEMEAAQTLSGQDETVKRSKCEVTWMGNSHLSGAIGSLARAAANILLSDDVKFSAGAGCEDLQVLRYGETGEYRLHHDSYDRVLTVLYYLNGSGETWFPFGSTKSKSANSSYIENNAPKPRNREEAMEMAGMLTPGEDGVLVSCDNVEIADADDTIISATQGDAIAFFNYLSDKSGKPQADWSSLHAGLPTRNTKWIANHWFHGGMSL